MKFFELSVISLVLLQGLPSIHAQCGVFGSWTKVDLDNIIAYAGCTSFAGSLQIVGKAIKNVDALQSLTSVAGSLEILDTSLINLNGLSKLISVGDKLYITSNAYLSDLTGLSSLKTVIGGIFVNSNGQLQSLNGIQSLQSINPNASPQYPYGIMVFNNPNLSSLNGLQNLKSAGWSLKFANNPSLYSLAGLPTNPKSLITQNVEIANSNLEDISALAAFTSSAQYPANITIMSTGRLSTLAGLDNFGSISVLVIEQNLYLKDVSAITMGVTSSTRVSINDNVRLCSVPKQLDSTNHVVYSISCDPNLPPSPPTRTNHDMHSAAFMKSTQGKSVLWSMVIGLILIQLYA